MDEKAIVLMTRRAAEVTGMREGKRLDLWIRTFDPEAAANGQDPVVDEALTYAARISGIFVLVVINLPGVSETHAGGGIQETQISGVREQIFKLEKGIQRRAAELAKQHRDHSLVDRVRLLGVYQGDSPPMYAANLYTIPAAGFVEGIEEYLKALIPHPSPHLFGRSVGQGIRLLEGGSEKDAEKSGEASKEGSSDAAVPSSSPETNRARISRLRIPVRGQDSRNISSSSSQSVLAQGRPASEAEGQASAKGAERVAVLLVPQNRVPPVAIRYPAQIAKDGMPHTGSRSFQRLQDSLRKELSEARISLLHGTEVLGFGANAQTPFRVVSFQELAGLGTNSLIIIVADRDTEYEAARALASMGTRPSDAVVVIYTGDNAEFASYVETLGFKCRLASQDRIADVTAQVAVSLVKEFSNA